MTPETVLIELVDRVGASPDRTVRVNSRELTQWPGEAVAALKSQQLIRKTHSASSTVCPGCEEECAMPVHSVSSPSGQSISFIVCDKRDDINRVPVDVKRLTQWRCSSDSVAGFVADCLRLHRSQKQPDSSGVVEIGLARGEKRSQMLFLRTEGKLTLVAGSGTLALVEVLRFRKGGYGLEETLVRQLVDASTTGDARYTPRQARREARKLETRERDRILQKAYRKLKRERPNMSDVWHARQIAKRDIAGGLSPETIRKRMKKQASVSPSPHLE